MATPSGARQPFGSAHINPVANSAVLDTMKIEASAPIGSDVGVTQTAHMINPSDETPGCTRRLDDRRITIISQIRAVLFPQWFTINWLLLLVPAGFVVNYGRMEGIVVFVINFLAIIPLAGILSYATEELALRVGETLGGLLNASFGSVF